jgi:sulfite reductase (NADPH) flavoprotein alpha-component
VRGSLAQRIHVLVGRVVLAVLCLTSITALTMSASTLGLVTLDAGAEPEVISASNGQAALPGAQLPMLKSLLVRDLRKLNFPDTADQQDTWQVTTDQGKAWIDRYSGRTLASQGSTLAQQMYDWALVLHSGEGAWLWAVVIGLVGACVLLFWLSGIVMWWQARRLAPRITGNSPLAQADVLIFVASEGGSTWGFAQTLQDALRKNAHRVYTAALENFETTAATRQVFVLAATYGDGQAPTHAGHALARIAKLNPRTVPVTVLGFGDRQFGSFCAFGEALDQTLRMRGWPTLLPLERIHQQSSQHFAQWGQGLARALGEPLVLDHVPRVPPTTRLTLVSRQDFAGRPGSNSEAPQVAAILRFSWPLQSLGERLRGLGLARFAAGDLVGIVPPGSPVPRYYSLASGREDGFVEICVGQTPGGLCSTYLLGLQLGESTAAFIRANPGFVLPHTRAPVVLVGAGTGVAPLAGFIRRNDRHSPIHLYFRGRDPARDFYFGPEIQRWLAERRVDHVQTAFSRVPEGGGYVQDAILRDAERLRGLMIKGAIVRVCGGRNMAHGVAQALDTILAPIQLSVSQLKAKERYAEDIF